MKSHVETRLVADCVQTLRTLIGQIIPKLTNDAESDINANCFVLPSFTLNRVFELCTCCAPKRNFQKCMLHKGQRANFLHFWVTVSLKKQLKMVWDFAYNVSIVSIYLKKASHTITFNGQKAIIRASVKSWWFCSNSCCNALGCLSFSAFAFMTNLTKSWNLLKLFIYNWNISAAPLAHWQILTSREWTKLLKRANIVHSLLFYCFTLCSF